MAFALGSLHWTPDAFWKATFFEVSCAYIGHMKEKGAMAGVYQWTEDDVAAIEALKRRFPDKVPEAA